MAIVWSSLGQLAAVAVLCSALFWGTAGYALSGAAHQRPWIGATVGAIFAPIGLIGLGIAAAVGAGRRRAARDRATTAVALAPQPTGAIEAVPNGEAVRASRRPARRWSTRGPRILAAGLTVAACVLLVGSVAVPWFEVRTGVVPAFVLIPFGTGLDIVIYIGAAFILASAVFLIWRPFRWAAVLIAWIADWWLFAVLAGLVLEAGLSSAMANLRLSLGDLLNDFGLASSTGVIGSSGGAGGLSIDLRGVDLTAPLRHAGVDLGPSWMVLLLFVFLANVALFIALRHRSEP